MPPSKRELRAMVVSFNGANRRLLPDHLASHAKIWIVREKRGAAVTCRLPCRRLRWWSPYGWAGLWRARSPRGLRCKRIGGGRAAATELNHRRGGQHGDGRASRDREATNGRGFAARQ